MFHGEKRNTLVIIVRLAGLFFHHQRLVKYRQWTTAKQLQSVGWADQLKYRCDQLTKKNRNATLAASR